MDDSADEEILIVNRTVVLVQEGLTTLLAPAWQQPGVTARLFVLFLPVVGRIVAKIKAGSGMPFLAGAALPAEARQIVKRN